jgi:hypothetical protein
MWGSDVDNEQANPEAEAVTLTLRAELVGLEDVVPQYANVVHATNDAQVFQVVFSQALAPIITAPEEGQALMEQGTIPARVVGRFVLPPLMMEQTIEVLSLQLRRYHEQQAQIRSEETEEDA